MDGWIGAVWCGEAQCGESALRMLRGRGALPPLGAIYPQRVAATRPLHPPIWSDCLAGEITAHGRAAVLPVRTASGLLAPAALQVGALLQLWAHGMLPRMQYSCFGDPSFHTW